MHSSDHVHEDEGLYEFVTECDTSVMTCRRTSLVMSRLFPVSTPTLFGEKLASCSAKPYSSSSATVSWSSEG